MNYNCSVFEISRQAYYKQKQSHVKKQLQAEEVVSKVQNIRISMPRLGTRKLYHLLGNELSIGRDKLFEILRANHLLVKPKRSYTKTTYSKHWLRKYSNLLKEIEVECLEHVYVSNITYIKSKQGVHYLSLITDAFSRKIVGYHLSNDMSAESVAKALRMAIKKDVRKKP